MKRRLTVFVLAGFHLLQATWLLHAGVDLLLPTVREAAAAAGDSCCKSACGCPDDVKAVYGCCCSKETAEPAPATKPSTPNFLEALRCRGVEAAMTQALTQPVLCGFAAIGLPFVESSPVTLPDLKPSLAVSSTWLEKVPI